MTSQDAPLSVDVGPVDGALVVRLAGELDVGSAPGFRTELFALIEKYAGMPVHLEMAGLSFVDSTGLGVLIGALRRCQESGGELLLVGPTDATRRVLELTALDRCFTTVP